MSALLFSSNATLSSSRTSSTSAFAPRAFFNSQELSPSSMRPFEAESGGEPLPKDLRQRMERSFGHDFSRVKVHRDQRADAIDAVAYAKGDHLHFTAGAYRPHQGDGKKIIAHELAHVVQQRSGKVRRRGRSEIRVDHQLERQADAQGAKAAAGESVDTPHLAVGANSAGSAESGVVQPILKLKGGNAYRNATLLHLNSLLPPGVTLGFQQRNRRIGRGTYASNRLELQGAGHAAHAGTHHGYDLIARMIASNNRATIRNVPRGGHVHGDPSVRSNRRERGFFRLGRNEKRRRAAVDASTPGVGADHNIYYSHNLPAAQRQTRVLDPTQANGYDMEAAQQNIVLGHELVHADRSQRGYMASDMRAALPANQRGRVLMGAYNYQRGNPPGSATNWFDPTQPQKDQGIEEMEEIKTVGLHEPAPAPANANLSAGTQGIALGTPNFITPTDAAAEPNLNDPNAITENMLRNMLGLRPRDTYRRNP